jgi:hypothetical protein
MTIGAAGNYNRRDRQAPSPPVVLSNNNNSCYYLARDTRASPLLTVGLAKVIPMPNIKPAKIGAISLLD